MLAQPMDVKVALLHNYEELCRLLAQDILENLVLNHCGTAYSDYGQSDYRRYGHNPGSMRIGNEKLKVSVPRIQDRKTGSVRNVPEYQDLRQVAKPSDELLLGVLRGLSTKDYGGVARQLAEDGFGLSASTVSRRFVEQSAKKLEEFQNRSLDSYNFVALMVDGKHMREAQVVIALGITEEGRKMPLGFVQTTTENHKAIKGLFNNLIDRGFKYEDGLLAVIDGAKGLFKAVEETFGDKVFVQRCTWHKRENVLSYLSEKNAEKYKHRLQSAYAEETEEAAREKLEKVGQELEKINLSAYKSLQEGLEETLTLHKLSAPMSLRKSLLTTNPIESLNSQVGRYLRKVTRWHNSDQLHRWVACALLEAEGRMKKISGFKEIPVLKEKIRNKLDEKEAGQKKKTTLNQPPGKS